MPVFDMHTYLGGSTIPGISTNPKGIVEEMKRRHVDGAVLLSAHARNVDPLAGNRILRAMTDQRPELYACLVAHENRSDVSLAAMHELMNGRKFVAMTVAPCRPGEPVTRLTAGEILNGYRRYGKPLYLHTPNAACVHAAAEIARAFPMLKVVFLGMGGSDWRQAIAVAQTATNVLLEISGSLDRAKIALAVEAVGPHRVLFGSGSPHMDPSAVAGLLEDARLSDEARQKILWGNAARLFDLEGVPGAV